jgi:cell pole-organizing protein PopZ
MKAEAPVRDSSSRLQDHPSVIQIQPPPKRLRCDCSLGSLVHELLHPLMKEWLDRNLAQIVEKCVDEEIKRMAGT